MKSTKGKILAIVISLLHFLGCAQFYGRKLPNELKGVSNLEEAEQKLRRMSVRRVKGSHTDYEDYRSKTIEETEWLLYSLVEKGVFGEEIWRVFYPQRQEDCGYAEAAFNTGFYDFYKEGGKIKDVTKELGVLEKFLINEEDGWDKKYYAAADPIETVLSLPFNALGKIISPVFDSFRNFIFEAVGNQRYLPIKPPEIIEQAIRETRTELKEKPLDEKYSCLDMSIRCAEKLKEKENVLIAICDPLPLRHDPKLRFPWRHARARGIRQTQPSYISTARPKYPKAFFTKNLHAGLVHIKEGEDFPRFYETIIPNGQTGWPEWYYNVKTVYGIEEAKDLLRRLKEKDNKTNIKIQEELTKEDLEK